MVKQRIVLKIDLNGGEKLMKKAMKIASSASGVRSVSIQGQNDQLVILGDGINLAELTRKLNKKVCQTSIVTVQAPLPQPPPQAPYVEMPLVRRCSCEIPNSGFCQFCRYKSQTQNSTYHHVVRAGPELLGGPCSSYNDHMIDPQYYPPVMYCRDEPDPCRIL